MIVLGNLFIGIGQVLDIALTLYLWVVIISVLLSWVNPDPYNPIVLFLRQVTEPVYGVIRRYIPTGGGFDFSPIVLILFIYFTKIFLANSLIELGYGLK